MSAALHHDEAVVPLSAGVKVPIESAPQSFKDKVIDAIGEAVFSIRWGQVPLFAGLWVAVIAYVYKFAQDIFDLVTHLQTMTPEDLMLRVVNELDMVMIANLVVLMSIGGYSIYLREFDVKALTNRPRWMNNLDSTTLKVQMGKGLVGVTSVHLLKTFMQINSVPMHQIIAESAIHILFILTTLGYCFIGKLTHGHTPKPGAHDAPHA